VTATRRPRRELLVAALDRPRIVVCGGEAVVETWGDLASETKDVVGQAKRRQQGSYAAEVALPK
jgi:hypothetical protein